MVAGIFQISRGLSIAVNLDYWLVAETNWLVIIGGCFGVLGMVAVVGGIYAIKRKKFGISLAGAVCALPLYILGIPAVILVSTSKREFMAEE